MWAIYHQRGVLDLIVYNQMKRWRPGKFNGLHCEKGTDIYLCMHYYCFDTGILTFEVFGSMAYTQQTDCKYVSTKKFGKYYFLI